MNKDVKRKTLLSDIAVITVYVLFALLLAEILRNYFISRDITNIKYYSLIGCALAASVGVWLLKKFAEYAKKLKTVNLVTAIFFICFFVKLLWVLVVKIEPRVDYLTFYLSAVRLADNTITSFWNANFIGLFPHIFGYSSFLSIIMRIFGTSQIVAPIVNAVLSTLSVLCIFYIGDRLIGRRGAIMASLIWIIYPSQTIYNMYCLSEPLYTFLILVFFCAVIKINDRLPKDKPWKSIIFGLLLAFIMLFINISRPISMILLIAFVIWLFVIRSKNNDKNMLLSKLILFSVSAVCFFVFSAVMNLYIEKRLNTEISSIPGYNIYVGFNVQSGGRWNKADNDLLYYYDDLEGYTPADAQRAMFDEAIKRITSGNINFPSLFITKIHNLWTDDGTAVAYGADVIPHPTAFNIISNSFFFFTVLMSLAGTVSAIIKKEKSILFMIVIFMLGLTMAHMLVEVAGRYHYSGIITLTLMAVYGIENFNLIKSKFSKSKIQPADDL